MSWPTAGAGGMGSGLNDVGMGRAVDAAKRVGADGPSFIFWISLAHPQQPVGVSEATAAVAKKAEVAIPHRPGPGSVAAFGHTVHTASDEFTVINQ